MSKCYSGVLNIWNEESLLKGTASIGGCNNYELSLNVIDNIITSDDVFGVLVIKCDDLELIINKNI